MHKKPKSRFAQLGGRLGLFLSLIPILIAWQILISQVPITFCNLGSRGFWINDKTQTATIHLMNHSAGQAEPWSQSLEFDPQTGIFSVEDSETIVGKKARFLGSQIAYFERTEDKQWRMITNDKFGETVGEIEFEFPVAPRLINDRFVVGMDNTAIWTFDTSKTDAEINKVPSISDRWSLHEIEEANLFYRFNYSGTAASKLPVEFFNLEVFSIDEQAIPRLVTSWPALANGVQPFRCTLSIGEQIVSINPKSMAIEYHRHTDGSLDESFPLLAGMDPTLQRWTFADSLFSIESPTGYQYFNLANRQWINFPGNNFLIAASSADDQHWLAYDLSTPNRNTAVIIEKASRTPITRIEDFGQIEFLNNESLLVWLPDSGLTLREISVKDGSVTRSWTPYWWVLPLLLPSILAFIGWSYAWLRRTGPSAIEVWFSIMSLAIMTLLAFVFRTKLIGDPLDLSRSPIQFAQSVIFALLLLSTIWMINSKQRIVVRLIPMLATFALLSATVSYTFADDLNLVALGVIQMMVPLTLFIFALLIFRRLRFRLLPPLQDSGFRDGNQPKEIQNNESQESQLAPEKTSLVTLQDMFLLVGGTAIVFATITPLLPSLQASLGDVGGLVGGLGQLGIGTALQISAWCLVMTGKKMSLVKIAIVGFMFLILIADPVYRFATGNNSHYLWIYNLNLSLEIVRIIIGSFVATFWLAMAFRFSGWRWERVPKSKVPVTVATDPA